MGASAIVHFSYPLQMARNLNHQDPGGRGHGSCIPDSYMVSFKGVNVDFAYYTIHSTRVHTCERGAPARHVVRYMGTSRARVRRQRSTPSSSRPTPCTPCAQCNDPLAPHPPDINGVLFFSRCCCCLSCCRGARGPLQSNTNKSLPRPCLLPTRCTAAFFFFHVCLPPPPRLLPTGPSSRCSRTCVPSSLVALP